MPVLHWNPIWLFLLTLKISWLNTLRKVTISSILLRETKTTLSSINTNIRKMAVRFLLISLKINIASLQYKTGQKIVFAPSFFCLWLYDHSFRITTYKSLFTIHKKSYLCRRKNFIIIKYKKFMAFNLRNRSFLKLLDFTPTEIQFMLDLARDLKRFSRRPPLVPVALLKWPLTTKAHTSPTSDPPVPRSA